MIDLHSCIKVKMEIYEFPQTKKPGVKNVIIPNRKKI